MYEEDSPFAEMLAPALRERLLRTDALGWLKWNGKVWKSVSRPVAVEEVRKLLLKYYKTKAPTVTDPKEVKRLATLLTASKVQHVLYFLEGLLTEDAATFDAHPDLLNCWNGVVDLRDGSLNHHAPELRFTKITRVSYNPDATHVDWTSALSAIPEDVADWLQVRYGQAATGHMSSDDTLVIQQGNGSNGKSTIEDGIGAALGPFAATLPEKTLTGTSADHPTDMMTLRGARLAVLEELPEGRLLPTKRLKDIVGTKQITARAMRQDFVTFDATHSMFVNTNYVPLVAETDHGTWRRLTLVRFPYKFIDPSDVKMSPNERYGDPGLRVRITEKAQRQAVLAWIVAGARRWYDAGKEFPPTPHSVKADTQSWREETDLIHAYARQRLTFDAGREVLSTELYADFNAWASTTGHNTWSDQTFANRFSTHQLAEENNVMKKQVTVNLLTLSRSMGTLSETSPPKRAQVWQGVAFAKVEAARMGNL